MEMTVLSTTKASVETPASWRIAVASLVILSIVYGAPLIVVVALQPIAHELGGMRSVPALAGSLLWLGFGAGGIIMGWLAERIGVRWTVTIGAAMLGLGFLISSSGGSAALYVGHGLFVGVLGMGAIYAPIVTYVSHWFDRRRGTALALISSGQYAAGAIWPIVFERAIHAVGWRSTMVLFGLAATILIGSLAFLFLRQSPQIDNVEVAAGGLSPTTYGISLQSRTFFGLLCLAAFLCCVPMAMPTSHIVALCGDLGIGATHGAWMLSVLLGCAFISRQFWGWVSDQIGGTRTVLIGSACQSAALLAFLFTQDEVGLFAVSAAFGLGFSGIIPAYILAVRELFPAREASWRVPILLFSSVLGMAGGGWLAGALYDRFSLYSTAFLVGVAFNIANVFLIGWLAVQPFARQSLGRNTIAA